MKTGEPGQTPKSIVGQVVGGTVRVAGPPAAASCGASALEFLAPAAARAEQEAITRISQQHWACGLGTSWKTSSQEQR